MAQGLSFAARLRAALGDGPQIVMSPLIAPHFLRPALPQGDFAAVLFTSQAGVEAAQDLPDLPRRAFCVGDRTAEVARAAGFDAISAAGMADDLIAQVQQAGTTGPLLHLRGRDSRGNVAARLTKAGHPTTELVVYDQIEQALTSEARALLTGSESVIAPLFSPRTAKIFARQYEEAGGTAPLFLPVLSNAIARALPGTLSAHIFIATQPQADALILASLAAYAAGQGS